METPKLPKLTVNKNGYEIRTEILGMAKDLVQNEYHSKFAGWELTSKKDPTTGELITDVKMPEFPGLDKILETAQKMYDFVNIDKNKK